MSCARAGSQRISQPRAYESGELGVILVSHDRWLLDALATHIWELEDGVLYRYNGGYTPYVPARELRRKRHGIGRFSVGRRH